MKPMRCWPVVLPTLLLLAGLAVAAHSGSRGQGPVFGVGQVATLLARHPVAWVGKTVLVRGVALTCMRPASPVGYQQCATAPLALGTPGALLAALRRLPLVGPLLASQQTVRWGAAATYRGQLRAIPHSLCGTGSCYEAVLLLDATP
jgi:hypothetical protein